VNNTGTKKGINGILKRKKLRVCSMFKIQYIHLLEKIYKMGCFEGSGVPVLYVYIGRTVPKG
jgi:hypothetical protein